MMKNIYFCLLALLLGGCNTLQLNSTKEIGPITVVKSSSYDVTPWAVTDILPGGGNAAFTGVPVLEMLDADSVDVILQDFVIPELGVAVEVPVELVLLNERNIEPLDINGKLFNFTYTLNPEKKSLVTMTVVQTSHDDHGPAPEGVFMRETTIELLATMIPLDGGEKIVTPASVFVKSPFPIPFSFDPVPGVTLKSGVVGDITANYHINKTERQKNLYGLGGMLQVPLA